MTSLDKQRIRDALAEKIYTRLVTDGAETAMDEDADLAFEMANMFMEARETAHKSDARKEGDDDLAG